MARITVHYINFFVIIFRHVFAKEKKGSIHEHHPKTLDIETTWRKQKISLAKLALDFSNEFNQPISISGLSRIIANKEQLLASMNAAPEIETKKNKKIVSLYRAQFEADLEKLLEKKIHKRKELKNLNWRMLNTNFKLKKIVMEKNS